MKILAIGAAGFLGSFIIRELLERGASVTVADFKEKPTDFPANVKYEHVDVTDFENVKKLVADSKPDVVINLAGLLTSLCEREPFQATRVNVMGTANVLEACRQNSVKRAILASSAGVCSPDRIDTREIRPVSPDVSMYGATKFYDEILARQYHKNFGMEVACLRYTLIYGPGAVATPGNAQRLKDIESCVTGKEVEIGDALGEDMVHLLHVADAAHATVLAAMNGEEVNGVFNVSGVPEDFMSFSEIVELLRSSFPQAGNVNFNGRKAPQEFGFYSHSKAQRTFGYTPTIKARQGLVENGKTRIGQTDPVQ